MDYLIRKLGKSGVRRREYDDNLAVLNFNKKTHLICGVTKDMIKVLPLVASEICANVLMF